MHNPNFDLSNITGCPFWTRLLFNVKLGYSREVHALKTRIHRFRNRKKRKGIGLIEFVGEEVIDDKQKAEAFGDRIECILKMKIIRIIMPLSKGKLAVVLRRMESK